MGDLQNDVKVRENKNMLNNNQKDVFNSIETFRSDMPYE